MNKYISSRRFLELIEVPLVDVLIADNSYESEGEFVEDCRKESRLESERIRLESEFR